MRSGILLLLAASLILASCSSKEHEEPREGAAAVLTQDTLPRLAITFILGMDANLHNPYYSLASDYYRLNDSEKTEVVIDTVFSLAGVLSYLAQNKPANGRPWGLINLVSHGNEFIDLSATVTPFGPRISSMSLTRAIQADTIVPKLDSTIVDTRTLVHLHGCAVGKNTALLTMLGKAFNSASPPIVKASKLFEYYSNPSPNRNPMLTRHYYAKVWYAFFRPDAVPSNEAFANDLRSRFPNDNVDWDAALVRTHPDDPSEEYHTTFFVPVSIEEFFKMPEEIPDVRARSKQEKWIDSKPQFQSLVSQTSIPKEYFETKFFRNTYIDSTSLDLTPTYSLRVKARAGVTCIIKPMLETGAPDERAFPAYIPPPNDTTYFGFGMR